MDNAPSLPSPHLSAGSNLDDRERGVSPFRFLPSAPLRSYFSSGWAFLIPYLLVYLLYYWLKWSVNTSTAHVPSLLHVYWALHAANLILGAFALRAGWRQLRVPDFRFPTSIFLCWFLLALVFFIPGTYLEYPADPWTHLSRITEWATRSEVGAHSAWLKFPYFFSYSFLEQVPVEKQLFWLTIYYVGACLLLCWQYFRLAITVGIGTRASIIFVFLQVLLLGNSTFSFYRYYGISSTIFSQLGAVALVRIAAKSVIETGSRDGWKLWKLLYFRYSALLFSALFIIPLVAFSHVQGLGIVGLGLAGVAFWRLLEWRRAMILWLGGVVLLLSVSAIYWLPRHPAIDAAFRPLGILNFWYGFNILSFHSMAGDRTMQIIGLLGVANLIAGLLLLRSNNIVGWLTVMPVLALCFPFVAIPFAGALANHSGWGSIIAFHRMFFAVPAGMALVALGETFYRNLCSRANELRQNKAMHVLFASRSFAFLCLLLSLLGLTSIPASGPVYNRFWQVLARPADDLAMHPVLEEAARYCHSQFYRPDSLFAATSGLSYVICAQKSANLVCGRRSFYNDNSVPAYDLMHINEILREWRQGKLVVVLPDPTLVFTPYSFAAICSHHWLPQEVALAVSGVRELQTMTSSSHLLVASSSGQISFYQNK